MGDIRQWELKSHSYQIADTGDYDGHYELTDGMTSLVTKDDVCGEDAARLTAMLNEMGINWEDWNANNLEFELHLERQQCNKWIEIARILYEDLKHGFSMEALEQDLKQYEEIRDNNPGPSTKLSDFGKQLSDIINQDGDEKTDGECLDEIIDLLKSKGMYHART